MVKLKYDKGGCLGCPKEMGCLGSGCLYCWEPVLVCDKCGQKVDGLYRDEDGEYWTEFDHCIIRRRWIMITEVYVVYFIWLVYYDDERCNVIGIYSTKEQAQQVIKRFETSQYFRYHYIDKNALDPDFDNLGSFEVFVKKVAIDSQLPLQKDEIYILCDP